MGLTHEYLTLHEHASEDYIVSRARHIFHVRRDNEKNGGEILPSGQIRQVFISPGGICDSPMKLHDASVLLHMKKCVTKPGRADSELRKL